jgi:hypothetical protein
LNFYRHTRLCEQCFNPGKYSARCTCVSSTEDTWLQVLFKPDNWLSPEIIGHEGLGMLDKISAPPEDFWRWSELDSIVSILM